ncbi:MAG: class I SAM-dependent methyltransferase [Candidatus Wallbacteria bacterium]|nr:class I SAM-dependent methyltransferase [Candidatus Wallbacteria bacterium]
MTPSSRPTACRGCGASIPRPFLDLGSTPLANSLVAASHLDSKEPVYPLAVAYCAACHLVQLTDTVPPEAIFSEYVYFSSFSTSFVEHARSMAEELAGSLTLGAGSRVLEVASNDGYLLQFFQKKGIPVLGVEPARNIAKVAEERGIPTLVRFFGADAVSEILERFGPVDLLIGNNVLAHVPDILGFLGAVQAVLKPGGTAVFEFPYVRDLLEKSEFDTIYHEHVFYFSLAAVEGLARRTGLQVADVSHQAVHGGSLRVSLARQGARAASERVESQLADERREGLCDAARFETFSSSVTRLQQSLLAFLRELRSAGKRLAAYGAPAKGNTLLNSCGIGTELLEFTVDKSPHKQGLYLPGSRLPILAPEELVRRQPDCALILPWNIADEIVSQQQEYIARGGRFALPIPRVAFHPACDSSRPS